MQSQCLKYLNEIFSQKRSRREKKAKQIRMSVAICTYGCHIFNALYIFMTPANGTLTTENMILTRLTLSLVQNCRNIGIFLDIEK